jgi:hypothetical protein
MLPLSWYLLAAPRAMDPLVAADPPPERMGDELPDVVRVFGFAWELAEPP